MNQVLGDGNGKGSAPPVGIRNTRGATSALPAFYKEIRFFLVPVKCALLYVSNNYVTIPTARSLTWTIIRRYSHALARLSDHNENAQRIAIQIFKQNPLPDTLICHRILFKKCTIHRKLRMITIRHQLGKCEVTALLPK